MVKYFRAGDIWAMQPEGHLREPKDARRVHVAPVPKTERSRRDPFRDHWLEMMTEAKELGLSAATDFEIAEHFGVPVSTIDYWKRRHPDFAAALRIGKDIADEKIVATLYHKARGYSFQSEEIKVINDQVVRVPTKTHVPPSDTAMIFWLKNRQRASWTDQQDVNVTGAIDVKNADVRSLALALLATIQAGLQAPVIEHKEDEA